MNWITDDWRLKLLALGLAVLMLGAVAFSQNPPTVKTFSVPLNYRLPPNPDFIITNGPARVNVTIRGTGDVIGPLTADNITAFADASHARPGQAVKLNVTASVIGTNLPVQTAPQIAVDIDQLQTKEIPVQVLTPHIATGYVVDTANTYAVCLPNPTPCKVHFSGPASWEAGIQAFVNYNSLVNFDEQDSPNYQVSLQNSTGPIKLSQTTYPAVSLDFYTVTVHVQAHTGSTFKTVALVASNPAQPPPPQFHIQGVVISPATVVVSGDPAALASLQFITLPAIDLSGARTTTKVSVTVPYPDNVSGSQPTASITYQIVPNPSPSPSP